MVFDLAERFNDTSFVNRNFLEQTGAGGLGYYWRSSPIPWIISHTIVLFYSYQGWSGSLMQKQPVTWQNSESKLPNIREVHVPPRITVWQPRITDKLRHVRSSLEQSYSDEHQQAREEAHNEQTLTHHEPHKRLKEGTPCIMYGISILSMSRYPTISFNFSRVHSSCQSGRFKNPWKDPVLEMSE